VKINEKMREQMLKDPANSWTREYVGSRLHRFQNDPEGKNTRNIAAPSALLHVAGLPDNWSDVKLAALLEPHGQVLQIVSVGRSGRHSAIVRFGSIEEAVTALVFKHYAKLEGKHIGLSFSKMKYLAKSS